MRAIDFIRVALRATEQGTTNLIEDMHNMVQYGQIADARRAAGCRPVL